MDKVIIDIRKTKIGYLGIEENLQGIARVYLPNEISLINTETSTSELTDEGFRQINEYLTGNRKIFNLKLYISTSEFYAKVWSEMRKIPYATTRSYKELAELAGSPKGYRAIGRACNRNPIPIFIPCHRVISAKGDLQGYRGGLNLKKFLLDLEQFAL